MLLENGCREYFLNPENSGNIRRNGRSVADEKDENRIEAKTYFFTGLKVQSSFDGSSSVGSSL